MNSYGTSGASFDITQVRQGVAAVVGLMGVLMIVGFFVFPWLDLAQMSFMGYNLADEMTDEEKEQGKLTAYEIWTGENEGEKFTLDFELMENNEEPSGFGDVRFLDRFLILVPLGGLALIGYAWAYATAPGGNARKQSAAMSMMVAALLLLALPFVWQELSDQAFEDDFETLMDEDDFGLGFPLDMGDFVDEFFSDVYSTGEQKLIAGIAFLAALGAVAAEYMNKQNVPTTPPPSSPSTWDNNSPF